MPDVLFYSHPGPELSAAYWKIGSVEEADGLPLSHVQEIVGDDHAVALSQIAESLTTAEDALSPVHILQFASRLAVRAAELVDFAEAAAEAGFDVHMGAKNIPDRSGAMIGIGYVLLRGSTLPGFPETSQFGRGLADGHCLLVRRAVIVPRSEALPDDAREKAGVDVIHRVSLPLAYCSWRLGPR